MNNYYVQADELLKTLVSYDTTNKPGNERPLAEYIASYMEKYGFRSEIQHIEANRSNVVLSMGESDNKVIFTGHLDVVPSGDGWDTDPFCIVEKDGRFYGRGACDMKGGIAAMMASAAQIAQEGITGSCELHLVFVVDEEIDGIGTKHFVKTQEPTDKTIVIIGEPTQLELNIAHRGVTRFHVKLIGRQCHSGRPQEGINAIYLMAQFAREIEAFDRARQSMDCGILPPPNMTITRASSGISDNAVPGTAEMVIDCRTVPGETVETLEKNIQDILEKLFDGTEAEYSIDSYINVLPGSTNIDGRVCGICSNAFRDVFGDEAVITYFKACCDMSAFGAAGFSQTLLCGPGSLDQAHTANEFIDIDQFHKAVDLYTAIFREAEKSNESV